MQKIECYLKSLELIVDTESGQRREKALELLKLYKLASIRESFFLRIGSVVGVFSMSIIQVFSMSYESSVGAQWKEITTSEVKDKPKLKHSLVELLKSAQL
ncbi:21850_t:CDS:2, partial [Dentiscutata erythropus]